jgi:hypothetical protein
MLPWVMPALPDRAQADGAASSAEAAAEAVGAFFATVLTSCARRSHEPWNFIVMCAALEPAEADQPERVAAAPLGVVPEVGADMQQDFWATAASCGMVLLFSVVQAAMRRFRRQTLSSGTTPAPMNASPAEEAVWHYVSTVAHATMCNAEHRPSFAAALLTAVVHEIESATRPLQCVRVTWSKNTDPVHLKLGSNHGDACMFQLAQTVPQAFAHFLMFLWRSASGQVTSGGVVTGGHIPSRGLPGIKRKQAGSCQQNNNEHAFVCIAGHPDVSAVSLQRIEVASEGERTGMQALGKDCSWRVLDAYPSGNQLDCWAAEECLQTCPGRLLLHNLKAACTRSDAPQTTAADAPQTSRQPSALCLDLVSLGSAMQPCDCSCQAGELSEAAFNQVLHDVQDLPESYLHFLTGPLQAAVASYFAVGSPSGALTAGTKPGCKRRKIACMQEPDGTRDGPECRHAAAAVAALSLSAASNMLNTLCSSILRPHSQPNLRAVAMYAASSALSSGTTTSAGVSALCLTALLLGDAVHASAKRTGRSISDQGKTGARADSAELSRDEAASLACLIDKLLKHLAEIPVSSQPAVGAPDNHRMTAATSELRWWQDASKSMPVACYSALTGNPMQAFLLLSSVGKAVLQIQDPMLLREVILNRAQAEYSPGMLESNPSAQLCEALGLDAPGSKGFAAAIQMYNAAHKRVPEPRWCKYLGNMMGTDAPACSASGLSQMRYWPLWPKRVVMLHFPLAITALKYELPLRLLNTATWDVLRTRGPVLERLQKHELLELPAKPDSLPSTLQCLLEGDGIRLLHAVLQAALAGAELEPENFDNARPLAAALRPFVLRMLTHSTATSALVRQIREPDIWREAVVGLSETCLCFQPLQVCIPMMTAREFIG